MPAARSCVSQVEGWTRLVFWRFGICTQHGRSPREEQHHRQSSYELKASHMLQSQKGAVVYLPNFMRSRRRTAIGDANGPGSASGSDKYTNLRRRGESLSMETFSRECAAAARRNTGQVGPLQIVGEESVAAGKRHTGPDGGEATRKRMRQDDSARELAQLSSRTRGSEDLPQRSATASGRRKWRRTFADNSEHCTEVSGKAGGRRVVV